MPSAGSVHVDVLPDLKRFGPQLRRQLSGVGRRFGGESGAESGREFQREFAAAAKRIPNPKVRVTASTAQALTKLARVQAAVERLDGRVVTVRVNTVGDGPGPTPASGASAGGGGGGGGGGAGRSRIPGGAVGSQRPFTDFSPAQQSLLWTAGPAAVPAAGALAGALGAVASGFAAAAAGAGAFAAAAVPAISEAREATFNATAAQRDFQGATSDLAATWQEFRAATDDPVLRAAADGVQAARRGLRELPPVAAEAAGALGGLARDAEDALGGEEWQDFFGFVQRQAAPSTRILGRSVGNLATGLAGLLMNFEPLWNVMGPGLEDLTARFAEWGHTSENFTGFIDWTIANGPMFLSAFGSIAQTAIDVGTALAPLGTVYAEGLAFLAEALSAVADTAPWLLQLAVAAKTAQVAVGLFHRASGALVAPLGEIPDRVRDYRSSLSGVPAAAGGAASATRGFRSAAGGVVSVLGGPWGAAVAAATTALGVWATASGDARQSTRRLTEALIESNGAIDDNVRETAAKTLEDEGLLETAQELGLDLETVTNAFLGNSEAAAEVNAELDRMEGEQGPRGGLSAQARQAQEFRGEMGLVVDELEGAEGEQSRFAEATGQSATEQQGLNDELRTGVINARDLRDALDALTGAHVDAQETEARYEEALDRTAEAIANNSGGLRNNRTQLDLATESGRAYHDRLSDLRNRGLDHIETMAEQDAGLEEVREEFRRQRGEFIRNAEEMGLTEEAAEDLADDYLGLEGEVVKSIRVEARGHWREAENLYTSLAVGGAVEGPGTATSDSINARLSDGEHVWTAAEVNAVGGQRAMYGLRAAARQGALDSAPGFAKGGAVATRGQGDTPWDRIDDHREDVRIHLQRMIDGVAGVVAGDMADKWQDYTSQGAFGAVERAVSQQGVPYSWGGGGPSGPSRGFGPGADTVGFDCSSLVQWAWWPWVQLPRTTMHQINAGADVPTGAQRPGDLVFPHLGHVGMYTGDGRLFHTFTTGSTAGYRSMYTNPAEIRRPVPSRASGGLADGWTVVGEEGPELAHFADPARVYSHAESQRIAAQARAGAAAGGDPTRVILELRGDDEDLMERLRKQVSIEGGGDVQVALGDGRRG